MGLEGLREKLSGKNRGDRRLETALGMLFRYGVVDQENSVESIQILRSLPDRLSNPDLRSDKLMRDQRKLYSMVEYVQCPAENRRQMIERYFGIDSSSF